MGEEFEFFTKLEDSYSLEDILEIIGVSVEELLRDYLRDDILKHKKKFDLGDEDDYDI